MTKTSTLQSKRPRLLLGSLLGLIVLCCLVLLRLRTPHLTLLAQAHAPLTQPLWHDGSWYWIEGADAPGARLVRANSAGSAPVVTVDGLHAYALGEGKLAWIAPEAGKWTVTVASLDGSKRQTLWSGMQEPAGLGMGEGHLFWMEPAPALFPDCGAFPPLAAHLQLLSAPLSGGDPVVVATLMETTGGQVIGVHAGQVYVSTYRAAIPGATAIYRVPTPGGVPQRLCGEICYQNALLTQDGVLYWSAASRESSLFRGVVFIQRQGKDGRVDDLTDWLPGGGQLAETNHGIYYVDGGTVPAAWPIGDRESLPRSVPVPTNYSVLAVGADELLLRPAIAPNNNFAIYRMPLP